MRTCLFCDSTDITQEHIWSDWICEMFPKGKREYKVLRRNRSHGGMEEWFQNTLDRTSGCVCEDCNGGWMSVIEQETKPILRPLILGQPVKLTAGNRRRLAVWTCLRSYVFETANHKTHRPYSTQAERLYFKQNHKNRLPKNMIVWLAFLPRELSGSAYYRLDTSLNSEELELRGLQALSGLIGRVGFQLYRWKSMDVTINGRKADRRSLIRGHKSLITEIWPGKSSGPPPSALTLEQAFAFCDRLRLPRA